MCNNLHKNSKPISPEGTAWKLFRLEYLCLVTGDSYSDDPVQKYIKWSKRYPGDGFCMFLSLRSAQKAQKEWTKARSYDVSIIKKISYRRGIGKHIERNFVYSPIRIALCKEFKIL